jgi:hypothetical protein
MQIQDESSDSEGIESGPDPDVIAIREKYQKFWGVFLDKLKLDDQSQPIRPPAKGTNQYFDGQLGMVISGRYFAVEAHCGPPDGGNTNWYLW